VHAHAEGLLDRAGQLPGAQAGVGGQLFLGPGQDLAGELVAGARPGPGAGTSPSSPACSSAAAAA
jgi:hypothetical protein